MIVNITRVLKIFQTMPARYLLVLLLLNPIYTRGESIDLRQDSQITITTESYGNLRRIEIKMRGMDKKQTIIKPELTVDAIAGHFQLIYSPIDTSTYLGNYSILDRGSFPLKMTIAFPDSNTMSLTGKTLPYEGLSHYYHFPSESYLLEVYLEENIGTITNQPDTMLNSMGLNKAQNLQKGTELGAMVEEKGVLRKGGMDQILWRSLGYSSLLAIILFLLFILSKFTIMKSDRFIKKSQSFSSQHGSKWKNIIPNGLRNVQSVYKLMQSIFIPSSYVSQLPSKQNQLMDRSTLRKEDLSPELLDKHVLNLVENMGISYDEASLRVSMQINESGTS